jgi:hypothetical protein
MHRLRSRFNGDNEVVAGVEGVLPGRPPRRGRHTLHSRGSAEGFANSCRSSVRRSTRLWPTSTRARFATNISGGAQFGYLLLWVILTSNLMAILIQSMSAKLGIATGKNLPEVCRAPSPGPSLRVYGVRTTWTAYSIHPTSWKRRSPKFPQFLSCSHPGLIPLLYTAVSRISYKESTGDSTG